MPILDATNDTIDFGDVGASAASADSDTFHWTVLCDLPASGAQSPGFVVDNKIAITGLTKMLSIRHGGTETFFIRQDGSLGIGTGGVFTTLDGGVFTIRGQVVDSSIAVAARIGNTHALTTSGAKIVQFLSDNLLTEKAYIDLFGAMNAGSFDAFAAGGTAQLRGKTADGASVIGVKIGNTQTLANASAKIASFYNDNLTTEVASVRQDGAVLCNNVVRQASAALGLEGNIADGASAIAAKVGNVFSLATTGAKIAAFYSDAFATEKLAISNTGKLVVPTGGAAAVAGQAVLVAGTVTVSTTSVATASLVFLTRAVTGGTIGDLRIGTITNGTSFTIVSASGTDTSTVNWFIVN